MRFGNQTPTFEVVGEYASSVGDQLCDAWNQWGTRFYPCQEHEMELFTARDSENRFASKTIGISKPRQNGKSFSARKYITTMGAAGKRCLYSAHNGSTVRKMFKYICDEIDATPNLRRLVKSIYKAAGTEGIYFANGGCIEFQTRTTSGARGATYDVVVVDEAQELTYDQLDAIRPTMLASESGDPQMIYVGTPPSPTCRGDVFRDMHDLAHGGQAGGMWWLEWSVPDIPDMKNTADVLELAYQTNPALGYRIREDVMLDAIDGYRARPDSFAREYLGWWSPTMAHKSAYLIDAAAWDACATDHPLDPERTCYGVKFAADGSEVMLAVAESRGDVTHVELQERRPMSSGTAWLADWLCERANVGCCVVVDGRSGSQALVERMSDRAPRGFVVTPSGGDVIAAASMLCDAVSERRLTWYRPQEQLRESATTATRRAIGRGGGWGFGGADPLPIEACALALWGSRTTKRNPNRKARIG